MRNRIKATILTAVGIAALLGSGINANAQVTVGVDSGANWFGYMNVYELPANGGGFVFGQVWTDTADLNASFSGPTLTLTPNTSISRDVPLTDTFWWTAGGQGNKTMEANFYVQNDSLAGQNVTFTGTVLAKTLIGSYVSVAFIKDFAPDFSSFVSTTVQLSGPGDFSLNLPTINDPARHIQYGFQTTGANARLDQVASFGLVEIAPVPEPSTTAFIIGGVVFLGFMVRRQRSNA